MAQVAETLPGRAVRHAVVVGANGGIGRALCETLACRHPGIVLSRLAREPVGLPELVAKTSDIACDITSEASIADAVAQISPEYPPDQIWIATGWLHDGRHRPEKTWKELDAEHLLHAYRINAVGPALLLKHLLPRLAKSHPARIGVLSARVGSISDNRLGGWHSYRASKAALNMLIRNFAIELQRRNLPHVIVGLQPGTTDTPLSAPFQRRLPAGQLQTPAFTAQHLVEVVEHLQPSDSGGLFDFLGEPFAP
ncbi:MAG: SDR family NAD(P)-dependent oxidoreductase [Gammaproteobacteria bacterium]|nr:MAG: SDR family NAD(P)-dependent oxidoreductase [Gammaproteobacteria bacterium]